MRKAEVVLDVIKNRGKCHDDLHAGSVTFFAGLSIYLYLLGYTDSLQLHR
jgi:hypothetical protein